MPVNKAKKHFLGQEGHERLNCAEAVLKAFEKYCPEGEKSYCAGGGQAPGGECGALCAAKFLLKNSPEKAQEIENTFLAAAGSTQCIPIRKIKKLSCLGCVELAAKYLAASSPT